MSNTSNGATLMGSWNYDNRFSEELQTDGRASSTLLDSSTDGYTAINRRFDAQSEGVMNFETSVSIGANVNGVHIYFENTDGDRVLDIYTADDFFNVKTLGGTFETDVAAQSGTTNIRNVADLDKKTAVLYVNEQKAAEYSLGEFKDFTKIVFSTGVSETLSFTPNTVRLNMNYAVSEDYDSGVLPPDFESTGACIAKIGAQDSLCFNNTGKSTKYFNYIGGKFVFEALVYAPEASDSAYLSIGYDEKQVIRVNIADGKVNSTNFEMGIKNNIWQTVHLEGDTKTGKADLFVNGRKRTTLDFSAYCVNNITLGVDKNAGTQGVYFDDVVFYATRDYEDYCPQPVPATSDDYLLVMSTCSLWREGTHLGWDYVSPYDECTPLLGYYDEGIPEVSDWEIRQMVEHGIDAQQFCWYTQGNNQNMLLAPQKDCRLNDALHHGYFYAKYKDMLDYCILFENDSTKTKMSWEQFKTYIWDYWVEYYFTDPAYLKINNKPVLQIYKIDSFITMFGGQDGARTAVNNMKSDIQNYGFDGLILMVSDSGSSVDNLNKIKAIGADAIAPYAYTQASYDPNFLNSEYQTALSNVQAVGDIAFVPTVATGRNIMGWEDERTPLSTVEEHAQTLTFAKNALSSQNSTNELVNAGMIYFSTWNEFGEGHWLAPSGLNGYGYADEWRKAFTNAPVTHTDIVPTEEQKARICHLYNHYRTPIRSDFTQVAPMPQNALYTMEFNSEADISNVTATRVENLQIADGKLNIVPIETDPQVTFKGLNLNADEIKVIKLRMMADVADNGSIFFAATEDEEFSQAKRFGFLVDKYDEFTDIYIYPDANENWTGTVSKLRVDFVEKINPCQIESIEFLGLTDEQKNLEMYVDGIKLEGLNYQNMWKENGELYIAGQPKDGFYSALNFYHEWNRFTGELFIKTSCDTEFYFTVNSDTVMVNGTAKTLAKPFYTFNGVPVIPVKFVFDECGTEYTETNGRLGVTVRGTYIPDEVEFGKWEFNTTGNDENWKPSGCTASVMNGNMELVSAYSSSASTGYDPGITIKNLEFDASSYKQLKIRMKHEFIGESVHEQLTLYFTTNNNTVESEALTVKVNLASGVDDGDGYSVYTFELENSEAWTGTIKSLRFDPTNNNGIYAIDYIRLIEQ